MTSTSYAIKVCKNVGAYIAVLTSTISSTKSIVAATTIATTAAAAAAATAALLAAKITATATATVTATATPSSTIAYPQPRSATNFIQFKIIPNMLLPFTQFNNTFLFSPNSRIY